MDDNCACNKGQSILYFLTQNLNEDSSHYNSDNGFEDVGLHDDISHIMVSILYSSDSQTFFS